MPRIISRYLEERFFKLVDKLDVCWRWIVSTRNGYGVLRDHYSKVYAHRLSWEIHNGQIPGILQVLHRCDNRRCVNPDHLFLGTQDDNMQDMISKGRAFHRAPQGEESPNAKLSDKVVRYIREVYVKGSIKYGVASLARRFGVSKTAIRLVVQRRTWKLVS